MYNSIHEFFGNQKNGSIEHDESGLHEPKITTEMEYVDAAVKYALSVGWVRETQRNLLIEKYLRPIYRKCLEIMEEIKKEHPEPEEWADVVRWLNAALEATWRIGSTDPQNILRGLYTDYKRARNFLTSYAMLALYEFIRDLF
ncbi:MAG TPA: hypothetical protein VFQ60_02610 [Patescibacteria group bacterium]|nr:hypothetical protein [Patescibacteria group bacterium]